MRTSETMPTENKYLTIISIILAISKAISIQSKTPSLSIEYRTVNDSENTVTFSSIQFENKLDNKNVYSNVLTYPSTTKLPKFPTHSHSSNVNEHSNYGSLPSRDIKLDATTITANDLVVVKNYKNDKEVGNSQWETSTLIFPDETLKWSISNGISLKSVVKRDSRRKRDTSQTETISVPIEVRKCCGSLQYFNPYSSPPCTAAAENGKFTENTLHLVANKATNLTISAGLAVCANGLNPKTNFEVSNSSYTLSNDGEVLDISSNISYSKAQYCLEMFGETYADATFLLAYCETRLTLPKCCPLEQYFDEDVLDCLPLATHIRPKNNFLDNYRLDDNAYVVEQVPNFPACSSDGGAHIRALSDDFLIINGTLCVDDGCYDDNEYCVDYVLGTDQGELEAIAYYCGRNYFVKCCPPGEILDGNLCVKRQNESSHFLAELIRTSGIRVAFNTKQCIDQKSTWLENGLSRVVQWRLGDNGSYIVIESANATRDIDHYCIDDLNEQDARLQTIAIVCESDVENVVPPENHEHNILAKPGSLAKCCPRSLGANTIYYYSPIYGDCDVIPANGSLGIAEYFLELNFTTEHFRGMPKCANERDIYHSYAVNPLVRGVDDYANFIDDGYITIVSTDGRCIRNEAVVNDGEFCVEYMLTDEGHLMPTAFVCPAIDIEEVYSEKFAFMTVLLAFSCIGLFYTLISLFTTRVRRGIVSIRKVNTLAGRILVSFVGSHLIGFLALAIGQHENAINRANTNGCFVLAGFIQFFNLATFCWNTSICLESLLLTMNIKIKEWVRYMLHCLWAWGFPLTMTLLMFLMDSNREKLSCDAIIPSIGVQYCFIYKTAPKLLYFYLPIFITLMANILFLFGARALRNYRLKRLEKGMPGGSKLTDPVKDQDDKKPKKRSGMKIHQTLNAKAESLRLVLWTGGTWFLELAGFIMSRYILPPGQASWFYYLWYIPTTINALRGVGIFAIIVLTPDVKKKWKLKISNVTDIMRTRLSKIIPIEDAASKSKREQERRQRNMTMTTNVTSVDTITDDKF